MKVICINDGEMPSDIFLTHACSWHPKEDETYTVIDSFIDEGYCWYILEEDPENTDEERYGFDSERFANAINSEQALQQANKLVSPKKKTLFEKIFS